MGLTLIAAQISIEAGHVQPVVLDHQRPLRVPDSTAATDHFLEKNAWANPRHPSHSQRLRRHASGLGQDTMSFVTPVAQKRLFSNGLEGSASTIVEMSSGRNSPALPTPITGRQVTDSKQSLPLETPSKAQEAVAGLSTDLTPLQKAAFENQHKYTSSIAEGPSGSPRLRLLDLHSRNPPYQSEDASHESHRSLFFQGPNTAINNGIASSGQS